MFDLSVWSIEWSGTYFVLYSRKMVFSKKYAMVHVDDLDTTVYEPENLWDGITMAATMDLLLEKAHEAKHPTRLLV